MSIVAGAEPFAADRGPIGAVLCHGFTGSPQSMRPWAEHLAAAGLSVRLPRLPGHGTTWRELNRTVWQDWYGEVAGVFDELRGRCENVFVAGLSMGGTLALRLAEERAGQVAGAILVNPSVLTLRKDAKLLPVLRFVVPSVPPVGGDVKKAGVVESAYDRTPVKAAYSLGKLWRVVRADLPRVTAPVLLFRSAEDHVVEPANAEVVLAGISSEQATEVVLDDSYHVATLDNDAERIFTESLQFVRRHAAGLEAGSPDGQGA
jgi:carboxylesterase